MSEALEEEHKCPDGIPAWVMTFADLMSLLLAFFVLLFSFSSMDIAIYKELAGSLKDAFGVQREIKAQESPRGINIIAREFSPGRPQPTPINEVRQMTTDETKRHPVFTDPSEKGQESKETKPTLSEQDKKIIERIRRDSKLLKASLEEEISHGLIEMKITEKRIILLVREKGSFPSGSADVIEPFKVVVSKISEVFSEFDGVVIVAGHTDNVPINTYRFRSNWELSSSRAASVIHELVKDEVLRYKTLEISAFADTQPIASNETFSGRAKNRRVEIMMDYSNKIIVDDPEEKQIDGEQGEVAVTVQQDSVGVDDATL